MEWNIPPAHAHCQEQLIGIYPVRCDLERPEMAHLQCCLLRTCRYLRLRMPLRSMRDACPSERPSCSGSLGNLHWGAIHPSLPAKTLGAGPNYLPFVTDAKKVTTSSVFQPAPVRWPTSFEIQRSVFPGGDVATSRGHISTGVDANRGRITWIGRARHAAQF